MKNSRYYCPTETGEKLSSMSLSELHRLLTDYRSVYAIFSGVASVAKTRIKAIQSLLMKAGYDSRGQTMPEEHNLSRPVDGGGVSEHALLRYLERVHGIDLLAMEAEVAERLKTAEVAYGGAVLIDCDGFAYIMREDGLVKSIMPAEWVDEPDGLAAQESYRIQRRKQRDDHFRQVNGGADG